MLLLTIIIKHITSKGLNHAGDTTYKAQSYPNNIMPKRQLMLRYNCDVISEKGPYCGTNSIILDQLFLHFCDSIFYKDSAGGEKYVFVRCSLAANITGPDQTPRIMRGI